MNVVLTEKIPIRLWVTNIEEGALSQARDLANLPFAFKHVSVMPDAHQGYGMPIGGVLATKSVVIPNAVGVDIGCGMCAVKTSLSSIDIGVLKSIMSQIRNTVPVGFNHQKEPVNWNGFTTAPDIQVVKEQLSSAAYQLGTLGGGNHFIEIQKGSDGFIWVMIHSGSRNLGYKIANDFHKKAVSMCERWYSDLPNKDLSFLPLDSTLGEQYLSAMNFALRFAKENRDQMIMAVKNAFDDNVSDISYDDTVNIHHNFASMENHRSCSVLFLVY